MKAKFILVSLVLVATALGLSACGKRGGPFPPKDEPDNYPQQYPKPE